MKMDFPHSGNGAGQIAQSSNFAALVAIATARQTQGLAVRAMLVPSKSTHMEPDSIDARIAYFSRSWANHDRMRRGAFLPASQPISLSPSENCESAVNLDGSTICKSESVNRTLPDDGQESRGMEA
jgi:hypothetical protein